MNIRKLRRIRIKHKKLVSDLGFKHLSSFTGGEVIITMAVEDYTKEDMEVEAAITGDVSLARDLYCSTCSRQVLMSNTTFRMYREREVSLNNEIICATCFFPKYRILEDKVKNILMSKT